MEKASKTDRDRFVDERPSKSASPFVSEVEKEDLPAYSSSSMDDKGGHVIVTNDSTRLHSFPQSYSDRPFDIVIFGASGRVGGFLVEELALVVDKHHGSHQQQQVGSTTSVGLLGQQVSTMRNPPSETSSTTRRSSVPRHLIHIRWAVAGRSAVKLNETLCRSELSTGIRDLSLTIPIILADLNHHKSLLDLCERTELIINCAGPYSLEGEALIKACIEKKTNYIDLSHETIYTEKIRKKYSNQARKAGIHVINGCGFQSMSVELGLLFMKQMAYGNIEEVKVILQLSNSRAILKSSSDGQRVRNCGIVSPGMWNSWLLEYSNGYDQTSRIDTTEKDGSVSPAEKKLIRKDTQTLVRDMVEFQNRNSLAWFQLLRGFGESDKGFCFPLNSFTSDESQLIRGEMDNYQHREPDLDSSEGWRPIKCTSFISLNSLSEIIIILIWWIVFNIIVKFSPFRSITRMFPSFSSLGNVSSRKLDRSSLSHIKFCQTFLAYGSPGDNSGNPLGRRDSKSRGNHEKLLVSRVVGPEPNHVATATFAIQAALTLISEKEHLPPGGVLTPGAAFSESNIIYRLRRRNIKFEVLKKA